MENHQTDEGGASQVEEVKSNEKRDMDKKLSTVGWALFFIWIGIAFLAEFSFGIGLLGVGIITLGVQVARRLMDLKFE